MRLGADQLGGTLAESLPQLNAGTASLGSSVALLGMRCRRSSAALMTDRCCPLVTAMDRCSGHARGMAGEDVVGLELAATAPGWRVG